MKKLTFKSAIAAMCLCVALLGCTENQRARQFGGKEIVKLKPNEVLLNITWKEDSMWILTEDTLTHVKYFRESSSYGIWNGEVVIN